VRPSLATVAAALLAGAATWAASTLRGPPRVVLTMVAPRAAQPMARHGGVRLIYRAPRWDASFGDALEQRARALRAGARVYPGSGAEHQWVIDLPGVRDPAYAQAAMGAPGGLRMQMVAEGADIEGWQRRLSEALRDFHPGVGSQSFPYRHGGGIEEAAVADDEAVLREGLAALLRLHPELAPPPGFELAFEHVTFEDFPDDDRPPERPYVRSHLLERELLLDGMDIARADVVYDPNTLRPEVVVDLRADAAARFEAVTGANVGHRIAIRVGERIHSAPVIESRIPDGRVRISMGGRNPQLMQREAEATVAALRTGGVPEGFTLESAARLEPTVSQAVLHGISVVLAALAALTVLVLGTLVGRTQAAGGALPGLAPWPGVTPSTGAAPRPWLRAAVTAAAPLLVVLAARIRLPGLDAVMLESRFAPGTPLPPYLTIGALGVQPVLAAFLVVELAALLVPAWRPLRRGAARARLLLPTLVLALGAATLQAYLITSFITYLGHPAYPLVVVPPALVILTMVGACFALIALAMLVSRHGLGDGFAVILLAGWLPAAIDFARALPRVAPARATLELAAAAALAGGTVWLLRRRTRRAPPLRLPTASLDALVLPHVLLALLTLLTLLPGFRAPNLLPWLVPARAETWIVYALAVGAGAALLAWVYSRRFDGLPIDLAALAAVVFVGTQLRGLPALAVVLGAATVLDLAAEWRARLPDPVTAVSLDDPQHADLALTALAAAGIPACARGAHLRTLLRFFAPYVPIAIRVARPHAAEAAAVVAGVTARAA